MRTTLTIDDDVLAAARALSERDGRPLGRVVSELAREALVPRARMTLGEGGLPRFVVPEGTRAIDPDDVSRAAAEW